MALVAADADASRTVDIAEVLFGKPSSGDDSKLAEQIASCLHYKGFCELDVGCGLDAVSEARGQAAQVPLVKPPAEVVTGLLGPEASAALQELPNAAGKVAVSEGAWQDFDDLFTRLAESAAAYAGSLGFDAASRSPMLLLRGDVPLPEEAAGETRPDELTLQSCSTWLNVFMRQKLLMLAFLGPGEGTLQLEVYDGDLSSVTVRTWPGLVVLVRSELMSHKHSATDASGVLMSWVLGADTSGPRGAHNMAVGAQRAQPLPVVAALGRWAEDRLQAVADSNGDVESLPREWQMALHHEFQKGLTASVRGLGMHFPGSWDPEDNFAALLTATDFAVEFPMERWDHSDFYLPNTDPNEVNFFSMGNSVEFNLKTHNRHCAHIEGFELFDHKMFQISVSEAKGMDPMQRWCLECQYESLHQAGFVKKDLMGAYIGVMTGVGFVEWSLTPYVSGVTAASPTINSNRTSFVLGVMGPSFALDTELASAASALCCAAESVIPFNSSRTAGGLDTIATVATGVYATIVPQMTMQLASHHSSVGRCFSFQSRADGYIKSEGCGSVCVRKRTMETDGSFLVPDEDAFGSVSGWYMANTGKMSHRVPSASVQQQVLSSAARSAGVSVLDVDAVECHALGTQLGDAVEASTLPKCLRPGQSGLTESLPVGSVKTNQGVGMEAAACFGMFKALYSLMAGVIPMTIHQRQLNPHIEDLSIGGCHISQEVVPYRLESAFHGVSAFSNTGTNVHVLFWNAADQERLRGNRTPSPLQDREVFPFWPNGGSDLAEGDRGYFVVGAWSEWQSMESMTPGEVAKAEEGTACCSWYATVTLSTSSRSFAEDLWVTAFLARDVADSPPKVSEEASLRYAEFQIVRNKDWDQVLYPPQRIAELREDFVDVMGPDPGAEDASWVVVGEPGESFRVELRRFWEQGYDRRQVRAQKLN
mmetsp:Transcript_34293/g.80160  ORF Transcript_34293/g.80160 Transcript_34293/m.80160 type:complete len:933 (+) Transcript_34293:100-2898(+)